MAVLLAGAVSMIFGAGALTDDSRAGGDERVPEDPVRCRIDGGVIRVQFSRRRWPAVADHIADAQRLRFPAGRRRYPLILEIDRAGEDQNRRNNVGDLPMRRGFHRHEYPPAIAREAGRGAQVRYVRAGEDRRAGSHLQSALAPYCSSQRFQLQAVR